jgi:hypothetical protein
MGALVETEPEPLDSLAYDPFDSSNTQVKLQWSLLDSANNGGSTVLGYEILYLKDGESVWASIEVGSAITEYTVPGFIGGTTNQFTIAPLNKYGVGQHTEPLVIVVG